MALAMILISSLMVGGLLLRRAAQPKKDESFWVDWSCCTAPEQFLQLGCRRFGFALGLLVEVTADQMQIVRRAGDEKRAPTLIEGARLLPGSLLCARVAETLQPVLLEHIGCSAWGAHPVRQFLGMDSYMGVPIVRDGAVRFVVSFLDWGYRDKPFSKVEKTFLVQLARWIDLVISENPQQFQPIVENSAPNLDVA